MGIALTLEQYLNDHGVDYEVLRHRRTSTVSDAAEVSHVPGDRTAKAVVLNREGGYLVAIVPATCKVNIEAVKNLLKCPIEIASEDVLDGLFPDCEVGAVPPIGEAYGIEAMVDEKLDALPDVYFEAGDHRTLVHVRGESFRHLLEDVPHARISRPANGT